MGMGWMMEPAKATATWGEYRADDAQIHLEYENFAFLNHIKCSPTGERSKPSEAMWERCGVHVLKRESAILQPRVLVVLGTGDNLYYLERRVLDETLRPVCSEADVRSCHGRLDGRELDVIAVPHPAGSIESSLKTQVFRAARKRKGERIADTKLKLLRILEIIRETDEQSPLTAVQIGEKLRAYGIDAERKSICRDIGTLVEAGYDIVRCGDNKLGYYMASRTFEDWELKILIDAVNSAKFLTESDKKKQPPS